MDDLKKFKMPDLEGDVRARLGGGGAPSVPKDLLASLFRTHDDRLGKRAMLFVRLTLSTAAVALAWSWLRKRADYALDMDVARATHAARVDAASRRVADVDRAQDAMHSRLTAALAAARPHAAPADVDELAGRVHQRAKAAVERQLNPLAEHTASSNSNAASHIDAAAADAPANDAPSSPPADAPVKLF